MPELPEVETIKRQLKCLISQKIVRIEKSNKKLRFEPSISIDKILLNEFVLNIIRKNKYLIFETKTYFLIFHLGMTGQLLNEKLKNINKHNHVIIEFENENNEISYLNFIDPRRFGGFDVIEKKETTFEKIKLFKNIGIDPFESSYNWDSFNKLLKDNKNKNIKSFLLDQSKICGIGNIYASEIMFLSKINPKKDLKISKKKKEELFINIKKVLQKAIDHGGSTISDFKHVNGEKGNMQNFYNVYGRYNLLCKECNTKILKINQNQRTTYFCKKCQK